MQILTRPWGAMHYRVDGVADGPVLVFGNSLGTDLRVWDPIMPALTKVARVVRYDKPGHGLSDVAADVTIETLADDAAALIDHLGVGPVVYVGLSIGGLIGQALAARRPDLLRGLVISNSAAKIGTDDSWSQRITAVESKGLSAIADGVMEKWFSPEFRQRPELALWINMLNATPDAGYIAACRALKAADLRDAAGALSLPVLVIAGGKDGSTPPELVRQTADRIPGARFVQIDAAGHIPCVETPDELTDLLLNFVKGLE